MSAGDDQEVLLHVPVRGLFINRKLTTIFIYLLINDFFFIYLFIIPYQLMLNIQEYMSPVTRKAAFFICKNKDANLPRSLSAPLFPLLRWYNPSAPYIRNSKPLVIFYCGCTARFVSDLVGNPEDRFSHNEAHFTV